MHYKLIDNILHNHDTTHLAVLAVGAQHNQAVLLIDRLESCLALNAAPYIDPRPYCSTQ